MYITKDFWERFENNESAYDRYLLGIKAKIEGNKDVTYDEVTEFCTSCREKEIQKYEICNDIRFKKLFLEYVDYHKFRSIKLKFEKREQLKHFFLQWETIIQSSRHSESLLQYLSKETREQLKKLKSICDKNRKLNFEIKKRDILLLSKFMYLKIKFLFRGIPNFYKEFTFYGKTTHIDEDTLIHIFFRHYNPVLQELTGIDKSFFTPDIKFEDLMSFIENILKKIEYLNIFNISEINNIAFLYKSVNYRIYLKKVYIQKKGHKGNIEVERVSTFYPITDSQELYDLQQNYNILTVDFELKIYKKRY